MDAQSRFISNDDTRKRKNNMLDSIPSFAGLPSKRINTGHNTIDYMPSINHEVVSAHQPQYSLNSATSHPSSTLTNEPITMDQRRLSPNAITPAYASCNASSYSTRPTTPPFSMTLAHYNESSGSYTSSILD